MEVGGKHEAPANLPPRNDPLPTVLNAPNECVSPTINKNWENQTVNYFSYRKEQINFTVLCDQTLYFQTLRGLLETVIGLDLTLSSRPEYNNYIDEFLDHEIFKDVKGLTMIPSVIMAVLTSRLGILWLLNVLFLICVAASVSRLPNKQGRVSF